MAVSGSEPPAPPSSDEAVTAAARAGEPDRYLAALLAPSAVRGDLIALAAFAAEIARVPAMVTREAAMGEMRLQWWREALAETPGEGRAGHPVADAVRAAVRRHGLSREALEGLIDARALELYADPPPDERALAQGFERIEAALFALSARVLGAPGVGDGPALAAACHASGQAYGPARLLYTLVLAGKPAGTDQADAWRIRARAELAAARRHVANLPRSVRPAFLPLALVEPYLRRSGPGGGPISPLGRIARIAAAQWFSGP